MKRFVPVIALLMAMVGCAQAGETNLQLTRGVAPPPTPVVTEPVPLPAPSLIEPPAALAPPTPAPSPSPSPSPGGAVGVARQPRTVIRCTGGEAPPGPFTVAEATGGAVPVFSAPGDPAPATSLRSPNEFGVPRVFLVKARQEGWAQVLLPMRPNGSAGWIRESDVKLEQHNYRIQVQQSAHLITVWSGDTVMLQEPIGLGKAGTATPCGEYYITELLRPANPRGPYGPFAFGLSGFSDVLYRFAGGNGQIGLHGTNDPSGLGRNVSHGCIRMSNSGISKLAEVLPLGTPVYITA